MSRQIPATIASNIDTNIPSGTPEEVSAADVRAELHALLNAFRSEKHTYTAGSGDTTIDLNWANGAYFELDLSAGPTLSNWSFLNWPSGESARMLIRMSSGSSVASMPHEDASANAFTLSPDSPTYGTLDYILVEKEGTNILWSVINIS